MNADELIAKLRDNAICEDCEYYGEPCGCNRPDGQCVEYDLCNEAADIIESLQAQLAEAQRRADAAVKDLNALRKKSRWTCFACKYDASYVREICAGCGYNDNWEWRGDAEEGEKL